MAMEFHVARSARRRYGIPERLFGLTGNVVLVDFPATRGLALRMTETRASAGRGEPPVQAGELNAMGLIDEILHHVAALYRAEVGADAFTRALATLDADLGRDVVDETLAAFVDAFPSSVLLAGDMTPATYLSLATDGRSNRELTLEELLSLWLANENPAFEPFRELFDDTTLRAETGYERIVASLATFFAGEPTFGPDRQPLVDMLRSPAVAAPDSLSGQLRYIRERWGLLLQRYLDRLLVTLGVLAEEERSLALRFGAGGGAAGTTPVYEFGDQELEPERFSWDSDWMPRLVLIAKSTYVWLDQLSRRYGRDITRLDQVPDEELDTLARWGITGLWLIGLWERSAASERIKRMRGNPEAVASAYSLDDYRIAADLGGDEAYGTLRDRAWRRGVRLASDMVPNHMGIDSRWVIEHPDWFIGLDHSPFPAYSFTGADLSSDERVAIVLEDHYWDNSDAAVVFKRVDRWTGSEKYVYHGNDGTSFPWNDTAQLDYLNPEVREAVIGTILEVARRFPVIRFDAAMVLAKKHIQRLWYPEPGTGGGIPSRAEHGLTRAEFDARMPIEFWREVVDRVAAEVPDTLLLAEAFWLLEGYFVRTLGMHRVYNSAFMNMMRDEKNAEYRLVVKNTLEFDPEILKRYVNFMNNPDERTAVDQFGKGDKYFGVATVMATMPGLPMFGHGQVEGFTEKYGMEFRRANLDERVDDWLLGRHEREIFPLLHRRGLFADVQDFRMYDVFSPEGTVNEDVFAYSNRSGGERTLVVYHNRYAEARGWIRMSVGFAEKLPEGEKRIVQRSLGEGLGLSGLDDRWLVMRDMRGGLEYLRNSGELARDGLYVELHAYSCQVFTDLHEVADGSSGQYRRLAERLGGRGVPSIDDALRELLLEPVHGPIRRLLEPAVLVGVPAGEPGAVEAASERLAVALRAVALATGLEAEPALVDEILEETRHELAAIAGLRRLPGRLGLAAPVEVTAERLDTVSDAARDAIVSIDEALARPETGPVLVAWSVARRLGRLAPGADVGATTRAWLEELRLRPLVADAFRGAGLDEGTSWAAVETVRLLLALPRGRDGSAAPEPTGAAGLPGAAEPAGAAGQAGMAREARPAKASGGSEPAVSSAAARSAAGSAAARSAAGSAAARSAAGSAAARSAAGSAAALVVAWLTDVDVRPFLRVNRWEGVTWFEKEGYERLVTWSVLLDAVESSADPRASEHDVAAAIARSQELATRLRAAAVASGYRVDRLLAELGVSPGSGIVGGPGSGTVGNPGGEIVANPTGGGSGTVQDEDTERSGSRDHASDGASRGARSEDRPEP